jgi:hypothetical protein
VPSTSEGPLISQLPDGELDFLVIDPNTAKPLRSDLVPGTVGFPKAVGVAYGNASNTDAYAGLGNTDIVVTQLSDGSVDLVGFNASGGFGALSVAASDLIPGSAGLPAIGAVNQDHRGFNERSDEEGLQLIGQTSTGQVDAMYIATGIDYLPDRDSLYGSTLLNNTYAGWNVVDGAQIANRIFPVN